MTKAWESRLNIALSHLLNQAGVGSRPEHIGREGRKDVLIHHQGIIIVLEGSYDRADAEKDARKRIEQLSADIAIAIHYPSTFSQSLTEDAIRDKLLVTKLGVRIILPDDISGTLWEILYKNKVVPKPEGGWLEVDLNTLSSQIKEVAQFIINETLLSEIEHSVEILVDKMVYDIDSYPESDEIAKNIYEVLYKLYGFSIGDPRQIKEALFAQATLAVLLGSVYYESIRHVHRLESIRRLSNRFGTKEGFEEAVRGILDINYELIFDLVSELLKSMPPLESSFRVLLDVVGEIGSKRALLRRDLGGKVYHKVVGTWALKKGLATFYTQVPSAYLLLYLAKPKIGKVADFACGSGTLLVAAYSAMNSQHRLELWEKGEDRPPEEIEQEFHKNFINNCHAFDVLGYALQITILNLALHSPGTQIDKMLPSLVIPLGYREKDHFVSLGSLELGRAVIKLHEIGASATRMGIRGSKMASLSEIEKSGPFDLIVMNPPFQRPTGRGGREGAGLFGFIGDKRIRSIVMNDYNALRNEIKARLLQISLGLLDKGPLAFILKDEEFYMYREIWQAGEGLLFIHLADTQIALNGKICFVLPKAFLSGISWFLARTLLAAHYHIEYILVSYDSDEYNFSESTYLGECMFVAKRLPEHSEDEMTKFVMLLKKPKTSIEAIELASVISKADGFHCGTEGSGAYIKSVKRNIMTDNADNWGRFICLPEFSVLDQIEGLLKGDIIIGDKCCRIPITKFNSLMGTIGVHPERFNDTFKALEEYAPGAYPMIKGGEESHRLSFTISPNAYMLPFNDAGREMFRIKGGTLFVPDRIRITTAHVLSMISDKKALSNIFYAVTLSRETAERNKALCVWFNTTWGILTILSNRQETHGGWIRIKMTQWRTLPVPDLSRLGPEQIDALANIFDNHRHYELARIPQQYKPNSASFKARYEIDKAFLAVFGIRVEKSDLLRLYTPLGQAIEQWVGQ